MVLGPEWAAEVANPSLAEVRLREVCPAVGAPLFEEVLFETVQGGHELLVLVGRVQHPAGAAVVEVAMVPICPDDCCHLGFGDRPPGPVSLPR